MDEAQLILILIALIGLGITVLKLFLDLRNDLRKERSARIEDRKVTEALIEYLKPHKDILVTQPHQSEREISLREQELQLQRERFEWDQLVAMAKTAGWIIEKALESDEPEK